MKVFKYSLDKSSKKFICPNCQKKTFVKYIETETNNYLSDEYGRCDRENKCGYHNTPKGEICNSFEIKHTPPPEPSYHTLELLDRSIADYKNNNFVQFLHSIFNEDEVRQAIQKYLIGTSKHWQGATVFWQIDNHERVHAGKILQYNPNTGKRHKTSEGKSLINWVHSVLKLKPFNLNQCLFGLHLIRDTTKRTIAIVESEKTAVIISIFKPQYLWLSTGMKGGFKYEMLKPIKDFKIIAFPDKSEYKDWLNKANDLNKVGFNIDVIDWLENTKYKEGTDLADIYIEQIKKANH